MTLDLEYLRDLLTDQLGPTSVDEALADQAQVLKEAEDDAQFKAIDIDFEGDDAREYTRELDAGNKEHEQAFDQLKSAVSDTHTVLVDQLGERLVHTLTMAKNADLLDEWPGADWRALYAKAQQKPNLYFKIAPEPKHLEPFLIALIDRVPASIGLQWIPTSKEDGGDWGLLGRMLLQKATSSSTHNAHLGEWLDAWVERAQDPAFQASIDPVSSLLNDPKDRLRDTRPKPDLLTHGVAYLYQRGMAANPDSALHQWVQGREPFPIAPQAFPWTFYLDRLAEVAKNTYQVQRERDTAHLQDTLSQQIQIQLSHFPQAWALWAQSSELDAVREAARARQVDYDPGFIRAHFRDLALAQRPASIPSRPRPRA